MHYDSGPYALSSEKCGTAQESYLLACLIMIRIVFELILMDGELVDIRTRGDAGYDPLSEKDIKSVEDFIRVYYKNIVDKWMNFFVFKKKVRCTQITKKVK